MVAYVHDKTFKIELDATTTTFHHEAKEYSAVVQIDKT